MQEFSQNPAPVQIEGSVAHITFQNKGNGYTVLELKTLDDTVTVVGVMSDIKTGEQLTVTGRYDVHPTYGPQFKAELCERSLPSSSAAILRYLASGAIKGVGPTTATAIVARFGDEALEIIEKSPQRLSEIKGISPSKASKIYEEYLKQFGVREVMMFLSQFGVGGEEANTVHRVLGNNAAEKIENNPFLLSEPEIGFQFERADSIASQLRIKPDFFFRIKAGLSYVLRHNLGNGHTCVPRDKLLELSAATLSLTSDECEIVLDNLIDTAALHEYEMNGVKFIFLEELFQAENYCALRLAAMLKRDSSDAVGATDGEIKYIEKALSIKYEEKQKQAIRDAMSIGLLILTGGPGTGKTTTLNAIIKLMERQELNIMLAAPTGRAAKRMSELCGREAKTIHCLLEVEWDISGKNVFSKNEKNPLKADVVIIDELSMVDIQLFEALLRALPPKCRLIMVGDADQLPSVGAGNVLQDIINTGALPAVRLTEVFRQAMKSLIVTNAHKIVHGEEPELASKDSDFFLLRCGNTVSAASVVSDLVSDRLPGAYGYHSLEDIQVLCPSRKRELGTLSLNNALQERLNPPDRHKKQAARGGFTLREGDKIMQTKNNYDVPWKRNDGTDGEGVFNGDVGILESIDTLSASMKIRFDDRIATYTGEDIDQLELAYAVTIHKSQGSEFECVVLPLLDSPPQLLYRNLLYTAVTRAKKMLIIVGSERVVMQMVENHKKTKRYTALDSLLMFYLDNAV